MRDIVIDLADISSTLYSDTVIRQGENKASRLVITLDSEFTGYSYKIKSQVNEATPFISTELTPVLGVIEYVITNALTTDKGNLRMELQAYDVSETLIKTKVFNFKVTVSIVGDSIELPTGFDSLEEYIASCMTADVYDPTGVADDAFAMDNMVDGATKLGMTPTERTKLSGITTGANCVSTSDMQITGGWDFNNGLYVRSKRFGYNGQAGVDKYLRIARVRFTSNFTRFYCELPLLHTGTYTKIGVIKVFLYEATVGTVHASSWVEVINNSGQVAVAFSAGDVLYQQWKGTGVDYVDIWIKMREFARFTHNINFLYPEGTTHTINPDTATNTDGVGLMASIPIAGTVATYGTDSVTAQASINATVKTITMT